jgi:hypothetical protein
VHTKTNKTRELKKKTQARQKNRKFGFEEKKKKKKRQEIFSHISSSSPLRKSKHTKTHERNFSRKL